MSKSSAISRGMTKSGSYYNNARWDLVDAFERHTLNLDGLNTDDLPPEMRNLSKKERLAYVQTALKKRKTIQAKVKDLGEKRRLFIAQERAAKSADSGDRIDSAMIKALREQALALGFTWSSKKSSTK
jgi:hypothetical protein